MSLATVARTADNESERAIGDDSFPRLWSQVATADWRPGLNFHLRRLEILKTFEERKQLNAFRVEESEIGARLGDPNHSLICDSDKISVSIATPDGDRDRMIEAANLVFGMIEPSEIREIFIIFQQLHPIDDDYIEYRRKFAESIFPSWISEIPEIDYAILLDGVTQDKKFSYSMEFGIVSKDEIPERLTRFAGRMPQVAGAASDPRHWRRFSLPDVALFVDSRWIFQGTADASNVHDIFARAWIDAADEATRMTSNLVVGSVREG